MLGGWPSAICTFDVFVHVHTFHVCNKQASGQEKRCQGLAVAFY